MKHSRGLLAVLLLTLVGEGLQAAPAIDPVLRSYFVAQPTPGATWERFLEANRRRIKDPDLGIYDEAAKALMRQSATDAGQDHTVRLYTGRRYTVREQGDRAVILFLEDPNHVLAPWFIRRTAEGWQIDGAVLHIIGYNHQNQWFFRRRDHLYMFAFADFIFDRHGFASHRP